jgi:hypothetical protein
MADVIMDVIEVDIEAEQLAVLAAQMCSPVAGVGPSRPLGFQVIARRAAA